MTDPYGPTSPVPPGPAGPAGPFGPQAQPGPSWSPGPRPGRRWVVPAAVAGLVLGAGGVGLAWTLTTGGAAEGAEADAAAACEVVARTPAIDLEGNYASYRRWGAAAELAAAAGELDPRYASLGEALAKPLWIAQETFDTKSTEFSEAMTAARAACADL